MSLCFRGGNLVEHKMDVIVYCEEENQCCARDVNVEYGSEEWSQKKFHIIQTFEINFNN